MPDAPDIVLCENYAGIIRQTLDGTETGREKW